jgi:hypothetical protein
MVGFVLRQHPAAAGHIGRVDLMLGFGIGNNPVPNYGSVNNQANDPTTPGGNHVASKDV